MDKLIIISENQFDKGTVTVPNTAANLGANWLKTNTRSEVCRILAATGSITTTWADPVGVDCVALPAWNGSASSEIRVRLFEFVTGSHPAVWDSGWGWAAGGPILEYWDFSQPLNVNNFVDGATVTTVRVPNIPARRVIIDIRDTNRTYFDISRVVIGTMDRLKCNPDYGSSLGVDDSSTATRAASGDLVIDSGTVRRKLSLDLNTIHLQDRHKVSRLMQRGIGKYVFVSVEPNPEDVTLTQDWSMYGVITPSDISYANFGSHQTSLNVEEW